MGLTLEEIAYWGAPSYTVTVETHHGHPVGIRWADGTFTPCPASNVGKERRIGADVFVVVWDGGKPDDMKKGRTKGRLLSLDGPSYVDSITAFFGKQSKPAKGVFIEDEEDITQTRLRQLAERKARERGEEG